ncbi:formimidoylglutamate deiminase [Ideonella sp. YS5]|uniref:formimidoylglutamate deiminase n=1 Tax=Ideonella sp. YS5 TaxID=3453714 RepID=UPI003EE90ED5
MNEQTLWASRAWLPGGWRESVLLEIDGLGRWQKVQPDTPLPEGVAPLAGPVLPGLVNAHSHAFQRAFAGLAERRETQDDDFWSWRDRMYRVAGAIDPAMLRAIAAQLYGELLRGGYTQVCEFHYVQHQPEGRPYPERHAMIQALVEAAAEVGIGLTVLPVLYERAGFALPELRPDQARFHLGAEDVWAAATAVQQQRHARLSAGVAIHSLRAARAESIHRLQALAEGFDGPIHIHVAEQPAEVRDCLAATGLRPVEWLAQQGLLDARWQLVHATHVNRAEILAVAHCGSTAVICPSTEANLGDGLTDLPAWLRAGVPLAIGSDSQVTRAWREELRWLDYGQRLSLKSRNVCAAPEAGQPATAERLWQSALDGGASAAGEASWGIHPGARADLLVVDLGDASLAGIPPGRLLDALVFSSPGRPWRDVMVAGDWVVREHQQRGAAERLGHFESVMQRLWAGSE